jgi:protein TonB
MASYSNNALWSPYGAYELKAKYQRNILVGTGSVVALIVLIILGIQVWKMVTADEDVVAVAEVRIKTIAELGPPPTVVKRPPEVKIQNPNVAAPKVGIPKPVADEEVQDEEVQLATREELAEIVAPDVTAGDGDQNIVVDINEDEYLPGADEFVPVEILPEMIFQQQPEYPRLAKTAGLTGTVWVQALVDKEGNVRQAKVAKTSGTQSLDEEAVKAAYKNKFKPGIQNGKPVACWVSYKVDFKLTDS